MLSINLKWRFRDCQSFNWEEIKGISGVDIYQSFMLLI